VGVWTLLLWGCAADVPPDVPAVAPVPDPEPVVAPEPEPTRHTVTVLAVGDVLPHRRVKAMAAANGWGPVFADVAERIRSADVAFANLESPVAPDHSLGVRGEVFNAPASLVPGLKNAGFDVLSMANNHSWDQAAAGLEETRQRVLDAGLTPVGVGEDCAAAAEPVITPIEVDGVEVRIAWLALADLMNRIAIEHAAFTGGRLESTPCVFVPGALCTDDLGAIATDPACLPDRDALYFPLDAAAQERVHAAIRAAAEQADIVVVSAHWQTEYIREALPPYEPVATGFLEAGAHIVIGHHPHVLQPVVACRAGRCSTDPAELDGPPTGAIAYSLGNFASDMGRSYDPASSTVRRGDTRDGGLFEVEVTVERTAAGTRVVAVAPRLVPTWMHNADTPDGPDLRVLSLDGLPDELRTTRSTRVREVVGGFAVTR
jgi:poly-gamma-glutamate synthesis protein (capsule biosynthesis protein)